MNADEKKVAEMLAAGQEPSVDDLGQALASTMKERDMYQGMTADIAEWMSKLVLAHMKNDTDSLKATMDAFMKKHVQVMPKSHGQVH